MEQGTSLLYDLEGLRVARITVNPLGIRVPVLRCVQAQGCPSCGVLAGRVHSRRMLAVRNLPFGRPWVVRWDKRPSWSTAVGTFGPVPTRDPAVGSVSGCAA